MHHGEKTAQSQKVPKPWFGGLMRKLTGLQAPRTVTFSCERARPVERRQDELVNGRFRPILQGRGKDEREELVFDLMIFFVRYDLRRSLSQEVVVGSPTGGISRLG
jgi:hypothetical protein